MNVTRRWFSNAGISALLAGCASGSGNSTVSSARLDPGLRPQANTQYDAWVAAFRERGQRQGISQATLDAAFRGTGYLPGVVQRDRNQTEFSRSLEDYLAIVASNEKVMAGRSNFSKRAKLFSEIEGRYGVPGNVTAAIWGMESNYGARRGDIPVVSAVSTLAYDGRRGAFFEKQLVAALKILQRGDVSPSRMVGSWAGAMGHTQFIPTTFAAYAVDFRGDGRRDIWSDDPTDALASAAAYLSASGWKRGQVWGLEVRLPSGFSTSLAGRGKRKSVDAWASLGVKAARGGAIPNHGAAALLSPAGASGPAFLAFKNFDVILRYNNSVNYGIGVGYLSDRIAGAGTLVSDFPPDKYGMTIDDRRSLQERLTARGFDTGGSDGVIGPKSRDAIRDYQRSAGLEPTGEPSKALLNTLG